MQRSVLFFSRRDAAQKDLQRTNRWAEHYSSAFRPSMAATITGSSASRPCKILFAIWKLVGKHKFHVEWGRTSHLQPISTMWNLSFFSGGFERQSFCFVYRLWFTFGFHEVFLSDWMKYTVMPYMATVLLQITSNFGPRTGKSSYHGVSRKSVVPNRNRTGPLQFRTQQEK